MKKSKETSTMLISGLILTPYLFVNIDIWSGERLTRRLVQMDGFKERIMLLYLSVFTKVSGEYVSYADC